MADINFISEATKAASYALALVGVALWNERKRSKGSASHENNLNSKFEGIRGDIAEHRLVTEQTLGEIRLDIKEIGTIVGLNTDNGLRGDMKEVKKDIKDLQKQVYRS